MDIFTNIVLGAVGSIVATFILYLCSHLYKAGYKEDFIFYLDAAENSIFQIKSHHVYSQDYLLVINEIDKLKNSAYEMYKCLTPLSLWKSRDSKKLMITLLYDIIVLCEKCKGVTSGYEEGIEEEDRLKKIHKCLFPKAYDEKYNQSKVDIELKMIREVFKYRNMYTALNEVFSDKSLRTVSVKDITEGGIIDVNSFKTKATMGMRKKCFNQNELEEKLNANLNDDFRKNVYLDIKR